MTPRHIAPFRASASSWVMAVATAAVLSIHAVSATAQVCGNWADVSQPGPQERIEHAMAFDSARGVIVLFSGWDNFSYFPETWEWDGSQWILAATDGPAERHGAAMVYDSRRHVVVLFGGQNLDPFGDTWEWDGQTWSHASDQGPSPRSWHAMAYDSVRGVTVLFGGRSNDGYESDTWEWDGARWEQVADTGPLRRYNHTMAYDETRGVVVLFGGRPAAFGDTWEWDGSAWTRVATTGPRARYRHTAVYDDARRAVILFGGYDDDRNYYGDTWRWDGLQWTPLNLSLAPAARASHAMAFDSRRKATVLFGGIDGQTRRGDTWELRTAWWFEQHPEDETVAQGQQVAFHIETAGSAQLVYQWRRNGDDLVDGGTLSGTHSDTLRIANARLSDAGQYDCFVSGDGCGSASDVGVLRVMAPRIDVIATCPQGGPVSVTFSEATANGEVALIFSAQTGRARVPSGQPCAGTMLGLGPRHLQVVWRGSAGPDGSGMFNGEAPSRACAGSLQLIDLTNCALSNVALVD